MSGVILDELGRPLPAWMQDYLNDVLAQPRQPVQRAPGPPPLARMLCANCHRLYAVEGDVGDEQGGTMWFGPCCPTPPRYADVFIREASYRMDGPGYCQCRTVYPPGSGPATPGRLLRCHLHRKEVPCG